MSETRGCQAKVKASKPALAKWLEKNPAVILRWMHDAGVLSQETYFKIVETRPESNQTVSLLERVVENEETCRTFINVLQQVQEHYGPELRSWLRDSFPTIYKQPIDPIDLEKKEKKSGWAKFKSSLKRGKKYNLEQADLTPSAADGRPDLEDFLQNHKKWVLQRNLRLQGKFETSRYERDFLEIRYTELFITDDDPADMAGQHEYFVLANRRVRIYEHNKHQKINLSDILSPLRAESEGPKKVLVTGIAGIGKTSAMQRLMHDWSVGKALDNIPCALHFEFRELNLKANPLSFVDLIKQNHPKLNNVAEDLCKRPDKMLVVLDGMDEFKHVVSGGSLVESALDEAPVKDLVYSLLKGSLLPGASILVTTRPQPSLPLETFDRKVVILGFGERQVKEFCFRYFREEALSQEVFQFIMKNDALSGLSFIPVYCSIICTALGPFFQGSKPEGPCLERPPQTMTEVYRCYLCTVLHLREKSKKSEEPIVLCSPSVMSAEKPTLCQLGKLAYHSLLENKILFTKDDLQKFGVDLAKPPDSFLHRISIQNSSDLFAFFHMTVQEFFAALYCVTSVGSSPEEILQCLDLWCFGHSPGQTNQSQLLSSTMESMRVNCWENLQMFSRFFMGLLCYRIEGKLKGLVDPFTCDLLGPLANWFKAKIDCEVNQRLLNLLHCLRELQQRSVVEEVAPAIDEVNLLKVILNPADCATLSYILEHSSSRLRTLNLGYTNIGIQGLKHLQPHLHRCQILYLRYNSLNKEAAVIGAEVLTSPACQVQSLLMCGNSIGSEGVQCLWEALRHNQTLEELYVDITGITDSGLDNLLPCLAHNTTLRLLTIVGNKLSHRGKEVLLELQRCRPDLRILSSFLGDMGLLQAYLDWVQELRENPQQMESVKNVDALRNVLSELSKEDPKERPAEVTERAKLLEREIQQLLHASADVG